MALGLLAAPISTVVPEITLRADDAAPVRPQPPPGLRATVETLVKQLDAQTLAERTHAERSLLDLGPEVLAYLPAPELTPGAAVRESVKRIRSQLERRAARESAQASHVRLTGEMTVAAVLKEITTQTRNRVELGDAARPLATQSLRVDFVDRPFWDCLDDVCGRLKLQPVFNAQQGVLQLRPRSPKDRVELMVQRSGPFRLAVHSAEVRPIVGNASSRLLRITGTVSLEPRLRPLFLHFLAVDLTVHRTDHNAEDKTDGHPLEPWNPAASYELPVGDAGRDVPVQLDYVFPLDDNRLSVNVKGRLAVQLAAGTERIVFDGTAQAPGTARRRGGVTVRLRDVQFEPLPEDQLQAEIKVTVGYDAGGPAFESHRTWMFHNAVYFENQSGDRFDFTDYDTSLQANGAVGVDYRWKKLAGPATRYHFVYEAPTLILDLPLEIKLDAIPLTVIATRLNPKDQ
jgi:hypothetical protein